MASKRRTVRQLADEANLGIDETLVILWDSGFNDIIGPNSFFRKGDINHARRSLGMATRRELRSIAYWMAIFDLYETEFRDLLRKLAVPIGEKTQTLPRKAISRLRSEARRRGIDPMTGKNVLSSINFQVTRESSFEWRTPGHKQQLRWLKEDEVKAIYFELVKDFSSSSDPIMPLGGSDALLASAVFRPQTAMKGQLKYSTVETSAAALLHSIIQDHPFYNGNKRTALVSMLVFLDENGFFPDFDQDEVFKLVLRVAQHRITTYHPDNLADREVLAITDWLCHHCRIVEKGDRTIPFRKLRPILISYGCKLDSRIGNKINITQTIKKKRFLSVLEREKTLCVQVPYHNEGQDVAKSTIKKIRKALHLDDNHGIDSRAFYSKEPVMASGFIAHYRKLLQRLAKF